MKHVTSVAHEDKCPPNEVQFAGPIYLIENFYVEIDGLDEQETKKPGSRPVLEKSIFKSADSLFLHRGFCDEGMSERRDS